MQPNYIFIAVVFGTIAHLGCISDAPNVHLGPAFEATQETDATTKELDANEVPAGDGSPIQTVQMRDARIPPPNCPNSNPETCNGADDDCDGQVDEDVPSPEDPCYSSGIGECQSIGRRMCINGRYMCSAREKEPAPEICNGLDDDCDGMLDNVPGVGEACVGGSGNCEAAGTRRCDLGSGRVVCSTEGRQPRRELCNGLDDDCDDIIDNHGACGPYIESHCQVFLGWSDLDQYAPGLHPSVSSCPAQSREDEGLVMCLGTEGQGQIRALRLPTGWGTDHNDTMGFMFTCTDDNVRTQAAAEWIQSHCRVTLALAIGERVRNESDQWGPCPAESGGILGNRRCASSGPDGQFNLMSLTEQENYRIGRSDTFGISFRCESDDEDDENRGEAIEASVSVLMGLASVASFDIEDGDDSWPGCRGGRDIILIEEVSCAETAGRRAFIPLDIPRELWSNVAFTIDDFKIGIALRAHEAQVNP